MIPKRSIEIVLAYPSDVTAERQQMKLVVDDLNHMLRDGKYGVFFELWEWETDVSPGMHRDGPQGRIDDYLRIEDKDILVAIFWNRLGTPVSDAGSGMEHEIQKAIAA